MKKVVYITGCLGFIGHHLTRKCLELGWYVIGVDKETYAANIDLLPEFLNYDNFKYIKSDINDLTSLYDCDYVINTAAESHVDNSIINAKEFLKSNVDGVYNLLELIRQQHRFKMPILLHFSTDEVFSDISEGSYTEESLLKPSSPYSSSKACSDMLISAWSRTFSVPYIIIRPANNYGIGQYAEKLIPKTCKWLKLGRKIPLHDHGKPKRTWLHVSDTVNAVIKLIDNKVVNEIYNISGNYEEKNINVVKKIISSYFETSNLDFDQFIDYNYQRLGQDWRYSINDSKMRKLGWEPVANFDEELKKIVEYNKKVFIW
jgi:dTDP-glucose 4,6-dehydratase